MSSMEEQYGLERRVRFDLAQALQNRPVLVRWLLAGPVALIATLLTMTGMVVWWPEGAARINNIAMPVLLFPLIWAGFFLFAVIAENLMRACAVLVLVIVFNALLLLVG